MVDWSFEIMMNDVQNELLHFVFFPCCFLTQESGHMEIFVIC